MTCLDFDDIPGFVDRLTGGLKAVPEPASLLLVLAGIAGLAAHRPILASFLAHLQTLQVLPAVPLLPTAYPIYPNSPIDLSRPPRIAQ